LLGPREGPCSAGPLSGPGSAGQKLGEGHVQRVGSWAARARYVRSLWLAGGSARRVFRRPHGWSGPGSAQEVGGWAWPSHPLRLWWSAPCSSGRKFQSHPGVPPGRLIELASSSARVGRWSRCRCSGVSNPIRIPERRAAGWVWGRPPPTCAGSSRWVPSLEGLGQAKTPRCLPRHVVRVLGAPTQSPGSCLRLNPG
jgi:hypothetical protein